MAPFVLYRSYCSIDDLVRGGQALNDEYIAATARSEQLPVLTANVSHFERIGDIRVVDWASY